MAEVNKNFRVKHGLEVGGDGTFDGTATADSFQLNTTYNVGSGTPGELAWNDDEGTFEVALKDGGVVLQVGQEQVLRVENNTGSTIPNGAVVYISGSSGFKPRISLADASSEATSSKTFGIVTSSSGIATGNEGYVTISGLVRGVDTDGIAAGTGLWLSATAGEYTATKPTAPDHGVFIGWVVKSATNGEILVHIQNGYELNEIHDILIDGTPADNEVLAYDSASSLWKNQTADEANIVDKSSTQTITGAKTFVAATSSTVPLTVQGAASQSANLQEWQDSSGVILSAITETGDIFLSTRTIRAYKETAAGSFRALNPSNNRTEIVPMSGGLRITNPAASTVNTTIQLAASQTANAFQVQDSAGTNLLTISPSGRLVTGSIQSTFQMITSTTSASTVPLITRGGTDQTANLQEWQNNSGTVLMSVRPNSSGNWANDLLSVQGPVQIAPPTATGSATGYGLFVKPGAAGSRAILIRAETSQTANLTEWQNSAGTILARISSSGAIVGAAGLIVTGAPATIGATSNPGSQLAVIATSTSIPTVLVKSIVSQTSNLEEWQDSTGSVLASMSASGVFSAVSKSFVIDHPTKPGKKLRYGSLEGPENGIYVRGQITTNIIELPEYWSKLADENSITVNLTPIGKSRKVFVKEIKNNKVILGGRNINCFYTVFAERKDIDKLVVEE